MSTEQNNCGPYNGKSSCLSFRLLRLTKNVTLSEVAEAIGVCRSLVGKWERGELVSKRSDDMWAALKAMPSRERKYRIDIDVLRQRASDGGRAAHAKGTAHEFTYRECLKGGVRSSRKHPLGRKRAQMLNKLSQVAKKRTK